jgi:hypothetical protein
VNQLAPRHLRALAKGGTLHPALAPLVADARAEFCDLITALGGPERVSAQVRALVEDACSVGLVLRSELALFAQSRDSQHGTRIGTLAATRRASLQAVGLDRVAREVPSLGEYLARAEERPTEAPPASEGGGDA